LQWSGGRDARRKTDGHGGEGRHHPEQPGRGGGALGGRGTRHRHAAPRWGRIQGAPEEIISQH
jgi:hypothetical protein